jgi:hypothetical protein
MEMKMENEKVKLYYDKFSHYYKKVYNNYDVPELVLYDGMEGGGLLSLLKSLAVAVGLSGQPLASGQPLGSNNTLAESGLQETQSLQEHQTYNNDTSLSQTYNYFNTGPQGESLIGVPQYLQLTKQEKREKSDDRTRTGTTKKNNR